MLYTLLSVFEPSSHALQALADRSKPAAARPAKPSLKKEEAVITPEPEVQAPKASWIVIPSGLAGCGLLLHNLVPVMTLGSSYQDHHTKWSFTHDKMAQAGKQHSH